MGVERPLGRPVRRVEGGRVEVLGERAPGPAVPVFGRDDAAVLLRQPGGGPGDPIQALHLLRLPQIQKRADVEAAGARVRVDDGVDAVRLHRRLQLADVGREVRDRHGRVLDDRDGLDRSRALIASPSPTLRTA